jgi:anti-anti-sigma factor
MKIDKFVHDDYCILALKGEFDTFYVTSLHQEIESLLESGISQVILNLRLVKFINSTALGAIIRAHKLCRAANGDMVIAAPSAVVRDIVSKVGLDQLVTVYDQEEQAVKHVIKNLNNLELSGAAPLNQESVMITFPDETRNQQIGGRKTLLATIGNVNGDRLQFSWTPKKAGLSQDQAKQLFFVGSEIHVKFQVKMFKKGYFDTDAKITSLEVPDAETVRVVAAFTSMKDTDREALSQFAEDMEFLKRQLPH